VPRVAELGSVAQEPLSPAVLKGKQLFYDARDTRLARERYMSCASCHADGGHDGRTWDFTGFGEGLRNTPTLQGKAGMGHGRLHWSGNFDEVQDFENQIRGFAGGTGLITNGAPNPPMGAPNAGRSADLDALAAYVGSLSEVTPRSTGTGAALSAAAQAGRERFAAQCAQCHGGSSGGAHTGTQLFDVGTLKPTSGQRLGGRLAGIDVPPLHGVAHTAPYLHDGSAATLEDAVLRHVAGVTAGQAQQLAAYLREADIAGDPSTRPATALRDAASMRLEGRARRAGPGQIQLVPAEPGQAGAVWATRRWSTTQPFATRFQVQLDRPAGQNWQADGLAFVMQSGDGGVGGAGGGQGWAGLPLAIGAQLLTWNYNRAGLVWEGRAAPSAGIGLGQAQRITGEVVVRWDPGLKQLSMQADLLVDGTPHRIHDHATVDLPARYGPTLRAGITGATGGGLSEQWISDWSVRFGTDMAGAGGHLLGHARAQADGGILLTPDESAQVGGWSAARRWSTDQPFHTRFNLDISNPQGGWMADGLGLVMHGGDVRALGGAGGCQGSCDLSQAVRAMLLSWSYNQGGLTAEGVPLDPLPFNLGAARSVTGSVSVGWEPGQRRLTMRADLLVDGVAQRFEDSLLVDLRQRFGPTMSVALTAATGGGKAAHRVSGWTVETTDVWTVPVGGTGIGAPSCVVSDVASGRTDCVIVGTDKALYHQSLAQQRWSGWRRLGGSFVENEAPSCTSWGPGRVDCFLRGTDGQLWQAWGTGSQLVLNPLGGVINEAVSCTAPQANQLHCMARGADNAAWVQRWDGTRWSGWRPHGGVLSSAPSCASWGPGRSDCFVLGTGSDLFHQWHLMDGRAGGWHPLGGAIKGRPSCVSSGADRLTCYVRGADDALWQRGWDRAGWSGWLQVPGTAGRLAAPPSCVAARDGSAAQCSIVDVEGALWSLSAAGESLAAAASIQSVALARSGVAAEAPACVFAGTGDTRRVDCLYRLARNGAPVHAQLRLP
jgi:cytochrome c553